jgi:Photosystem II 10 kDa polypeptide PsbR
MHICNREYEAGCVTGLVEPYTCVAVLHAAMACFAVWLVLQASGKQVIFVLQGFGVYRFAKKYGANVDGYSPIYTPDTWTESGNSYKPGTKGLLAWCVPCLAHL